MSQRSAHGNTGATVDYFMWATGVPSAERKLPRPNRMPMREIVWEPQPGAWFNDYELRGSTIEHSLRAQDGWRLADIGRGAITFEALNAGGGLVVSLLSWHHDDLNGYHIVLDDDNRESYVLKLSRIGNNGLLRERIGGGNVTGRREYRKVPGVVSDPAFRLNSSLQTMWVIYQNGSIVVGTGSEPGAGKIVLYMEPEAEKHRVEGRELYHFGFARHGSRWPGGVTIKGVKSYRYKKGAVIPLPAKPVFGLVNSSGGPPQQFDGGVLYEPVQGENDPPPAQTGNINWGRRVVRDAGVPKYYGQISFADMPDGQ